MAQTNQGGGETDHESVSERRTELITVAIRLFSGRPYAEVSIDEIAAEAGVATGLLYYYFADKQGLYLAGFEHLVQELHEQLAAAAAQDTASPLERLMRGIDAHLAFIERYPAGYRELLSVASTYPEIKTILEHEQEAIVELLLSSLPAEVPRGPAVMLAVKGWGSFVDGTVLAWLTDQELDRTYVRELCSRVLYAAVLTAIDVDEQGGSTGPRASNERDATRPSPATDGCGINPGSGGA